MTSRGDGDSSTSNAQGLVAETPVLSHILTPGSSLNPTFLLIVDAAFVFLLLLLLMLGLLTWSPHFLALIVIAVGLWVSVKWFVNELKQTPSQDENSDSNRQESKKDS